MKVCRNKTTKRIIEAQSYATSGTLIANAVEFNADDLEEVEIDDDEFHALLDNQNNDDFVQNATYTEKRKLAYAPIADQLDMIYWDNVNGSRTWLDHIEAVKEAHPK
jgi:hypothetical protein